MLKVAILGAGSVGAALGSTLSKSNLVKFGVRTTVKPEVLAKCKKENTSSGLLIEACKWGDVIILALPADDVLSAVDGLKNELKGNNKRKRNVAFFLPEN